MRNFFATYWKLILALILLVLLASLTMNSSAVPPDLATRLRAHVQAIAAGQPGSDEPAALERAARHIETALAAAGYQVRRHDYIDGRHAVRNIEASLSNLAPHARANRIFIFGARYDPAAGAIDSGNGTAAVLELARLLKALLPNRGTELKFVFFVDEAPPWLAQEAGSGGHYVDAGNFIAFAGPREASARVRQALAAFRTAPDPPTEGLATPAFEEGVTLSSPAAGSGYPSLMVTDTAFLRYPYFHTGAEEDAPDYEGMARVLAGLSRTVAALAGGAQM